MNVSHCRPARVPAPGCRVLREEQLALHPWARHIQFVPHGPVARDRVLAIQRRDPAELEAVARECVPRLLRAAHAAGLKSDDASDAVQDALLVFVTRAHEYDGRAAVLTWLFGILYNKIRERRRAFAAEKSVEDVDTVLESRFDEHGGWSRPPRSPEEYTAHAQALQWLEDCMGQLPERRRLAFTLREVEQLDTDEICNILQLSRNNLGVLLFRARNALRECMESKGIRGIADVAM